MKLINSQKNEVRKKIIYTILFIILILILFLGLYKINSESLWEDELYTSEFAQENVSTIISGESDFMNPPTYVLFIHFWTYVFGSSQLALRLPSVIFGILAAITIFLLAKKLYDEETGLLAVLFFGTAEFFVFYMQEARSYTLLLFISVLSNYLFIRYLKEKNNLLSLLYALVTLIGLYVHYFMVFIVLLQDVFFVIKYKNFKASFKKWFFSQAIIAILFSFLFFKSILPKMILEDSSVISWIANPNLISVENLFNVFVGNFKIYFIGIIFLILVLSLFLFNLFDKKLRKFMLSDEDLFLLLYLFVPLIAVFIISQFKPIWMPRYLIIIFPAVVLIITRTILTFKAFTLRIGLIIIILLGNFIALDQMYSQQDKSDLRSAVSYIMGEYEKNQLIIAYWFPQSHFNYYATQNLSNDLVYQGKINSEGYPSELDAKVAGRGVFYIVCLTYRCNALEGKVRELNQSFKLMNTMDFKDVRVEKYEKIYVVDKTQADPIQLPLKAFALSSENIGNNSIHFYWTNDTAKIKFRVPENRYVLYFEMMGTPPAPIKLDIVVNNLSYEFVLNDSLEIWHNDSVDIGLISNETNFLQFTFSEDAFSLWKNGTVRFDRNAFIRNVTLALEGK